MSQTFDFPGDDADDVDDVLDHFKKPEKRSREYTGDKRRKTDSWSIRNHFGVKPYDGERFNYPNLMPNVLDVSIEAGPNKIAGGSDLLAVGKPGSGKSTFACHLALRSIEVPRSRAVWRASSSRSEWLPLAPWVKLCLPSDVPIEAELVPRDPTEEPLELDVPGDLERFVREVVYYDDVRHLNGELLEAGKIHVVYPDPKMRGLQAALDASDEKAYDTPSDRDDLFSPRDPSKHFWFGWVLDRVERGPHFWTSLILDEIGDLAPEAANKDQFGTYQKIELLRDCWVDARKKHLSIFAFGHSERDIHNLIRHKIRWRVAMNGTANPTTPAKVVGFDAIPMNHDLTSRMKIGQGLIYNQVNFEKISWPDYSSPVSHKLEVSLGGSKGGGKQ